MGQHEVGDQIILRLLAPLDRQASNVCAHLDDSIFGTLLTLLPDHRIDAANYVAGEMFLALLVVIMQPVAMAMDRPATGAHLHTVNNVAEGSMSLRMLDRMERDTAAAGLTPEAVAKRVHALIMSSKRPLRVPMDKAKALSIVKRLAPQAVIDRMIGGLL